MREIVLVVPEIETEQNIEIDVKINGRKKTLKYRVELLGLDDCNPPEIDRVTIIKHKIKEYEKDWELVEIGQPKKDNVPLMFRKKPQIDR